MGEPHVVWFDAEGVVDGHAAVFGPVGVEVRLGERVLATEDGQAMQEAVVTLATQMSERSLLTIRLAANGRSTES